MKKKERKRLRKLKALWRKAKKAGHAVVMDPKALVLIMQPRKGGRWTLPGGQLDKGEGAARGAAREVQEETGLKVIIKRKRWLQTLMYGGGKVGRVFLALAKKARVKLSKEHRKARWVSVKKAARMLIKRHRQAVLALA